MRRKLKDRGLEKGFRIYGDTTTMTRAVESKEAISGNIEL